MSPLHTGESYASGKRELVRVSLGDPIELGGHGLALWISALDGDGTHNLEWSSDPQMNGRPHWQVRADGEYRPPFLMIDREQAQELAAALWRAGVRTKESMESGAHRSAIEGHLSDMRELVAHFAKVQLPGTKGGGA